MSVSDCSSSDEDFDFINNATKRTREAIQSQRVLDLASIPPKTLDLVPTLDKPLDILDISQSGSEKEEDNEEKSKRILPEAFDIEPDCTPPPPTITEASGRPKRGKRKSLKGVSKAMKTTKALKKLIDISTRNTGNDKSLEISDEDDDEDGGGSFNMKYQWRDEIFKIEVMEIELMTDVLERIAEQLKEDLSKLKFSMENSSEPFTPGAKMSVQDCQVNIGSILEVRQVSSLKTNSSVEISKEQSNNKKEGTIRIKFQTAEQKKKSSKSSELILELDENETFEQVANKLVQLDKKKFKNPKNLRLVFDGDSVDPKMTPKDLEMEDEDCIDIQLKK